MDTPQFASFQFLNPAAMNSATNQITSSTYEEIQSLFSEGFIGLSDIVFTSSGLSLTIVFTAPVCLITSTGQMCHAHGTITGQDTKTYTVNLAPYVPGSGSQTVYVYATPYQIQMAPYTVIGPPIGHSDYQADFVPYTAYAYQRDSFTIAAGTSVPSGSFELCRTTLSAGQSSGVVLNTGYALVAEPLFGTPSLGTAGEYVYSSSATLTASDAGKFIFYYISATGNGVFTLPAADSAAPFTIPIVIVNLSSYALTIQTQNSDVLFNNVNTINQYQSVALNNNSSSSWASYWNTAGSPSPFVVGNAVANNQAVALGQLNAAVSAAVTSTLASLFAVPYNVTGARGLNVTYTNTTGKPMFVSVSGTSNGVGQNLILTVGATVVAGIGQPNTGSGIFVNSVVGAGQTYKVTGPNFNNWVETY